VVDGPGASARFRAIGSVAADRNGNLYLADAASLLRKIAPDGSVSTIAGKLPPDVLSSPIVPADGSGSSAVFASLGGLTVNGAGNLVALDTSSYGVVGPRTALRIVTPAGTASTVVLQDQAGFLLASGAGGALYLAHDSQINTLNADGSGAVFAGKEKSRSGDVDGSGAAARFNAGASCMSSIPAPAACTCCLPAWRCARSRRLAWSVPCCSRAPCALRPAWRWTMPAIATYRNTRPTSSLRRTTAAFFTRSRRTAR
jgi:hypothetical protein